MAPGKTDSYRLALWDLATQLARLAMLSDPVVLRRWVDEGVDLVEAESAMCGIAPDPDLRRYPFRTAGTALERSLVRVRGLSSAARARALRRWRWQLRGYVVGIERHLRHDGAAERARWLRAMVACFDDLDPAAAMLDEPSIGIGPPPAVRAAVLRMAELQLQLRDTVERCISELQRTGAVDVDLIASLSRVVDLAREGLARLPGPQQLHSIVRSGEHVIASGSQAPGAPTGAEPRRGRRWASMLRSIVPAPLRGTWERLRPQRCDPADPGRDSGRIRARSDGTPGTHPVAVLLEPTGELPFVEAEDGTRWIAAVLGFADGPSGSDPVTLPAPGPAPTVAERPASDGTGSRTLTAAPSSAEVDIPPATQDPVLEMDAPSALGLR